MRGKKTRLGDDGETEKREKRLIAKEMNGRKEQGTSTESQKKEQRGWRDRDRASQRDG